MRCLTINHLVHRGGNKHQVFDAENMSGCYRKPVEDFRKRILVHRGGNKHQVFDAENMSGCYRKPVEDFRKRVLA